MCRMTSLRNAVIVKQQGDVRKRRLRLIKESKERVPKDMLHPDAPRLRPHFLEDLEKAGGRKRALFGRDALQPGFPRCRFLKGDHGLVRRMRQVSEDPAGS